MVTNMQRGEVWWVNFEATIGSEIKKRPAIIVSNNITMKTQIEL